MRLWAALALAASPRADRGVLSRAQLADAVHDRRLLRDH